MVNAPGDVDQKLTNGHYNMINVFVIRFMLVNGSESTTNLWQISKPGRQAVFCGG